MKNWDGGEEEMEGDMEGEKKGRGFRDLVRIWANTRKKVHKMRHKVSDLRQSSGKTHHKGGDAPQGWRNPATLKPAEEGIARDRLSCFLLLCELLRLSCFLLNKIFDQVIY